MRVVNYEAAFVRLFRAILAGCHACVRFKASAKMSRIPEACLRRNGFHHFGIRREQMTRRSNAAAD